MPPKILVPVDYSDSSRAALHFALYIATEHGATLDVVHVCSGAGLPSVAIPESGALLSEADENAEEMERQRLSAYVAAAKPGDA